MLGIDNITIIKQSNVTDCHLSEQLLSTTSERTKHIYKFVWAICYYRIKTHTCIMHNGEQTWQTEFQQHGCHIVTYFFELLFFSADFKTDHSDVTLVCLPDWCEMCSHSSEHKKVK